MRVFLLIVLYNRDFPLSAANLKACAKQGVTLLIYDNSTDGKPRRQTVEAAGSVYLGGKGNQGLSKAYNEAAAYCLSLTNQGRLCLFDDDTELTAAYLDAVTKTPLCDTEILVPRLYAGEQLISPAILKPNFHCDFFPSPQAAAAYNGAALTALNSGMAVPLRVFNAYAYDERLFLDGIDHIFIRDMRQRGMKIKIMNCDLSHGLSAVEKPALNGALHRFGIFKNDVKIFAGQRWRGILRRRTLKLTLQYRTLAFIKAYLKED